MKWQGIIYSINPDDRPLKKSLRDTLFRKIEDSRLMAYDISKYKTFNESNPDKTYDY